MNLIALHVTDVLKNSVVKIWLVIWNARNVGNLPGEFFLLFKPPKLLLMKEEVVAVVAHAVPPGAVPVKKRQIIY